MSDAVEEPTWNDGALPEQAPDGTEAAGWSSDLQNAYDAVRGKDSRSNTYDDGHSRLHDAAQSRLNNEDHQTGVRISGTDTRGNTQYNARPTDSNTGMNALQSAAAPITAGLNTYNNVSKAIENGKNDWGLISTAVTGLATDVLAVQDMVKQYEAFVEKITDPKFDPIQWLAGTIIDFLMQLFQPLEDLVGLVSGNETRMRKSAEMWVKVSEGCRQTGDYISQTGTAALEDWVGTDGDAARLSVDEAGRAVSTMGFLAVGANGLLLQMADVAKLLRQDIVDLIAKGVSWMITRLLPQVAAGIASFGATVATAIASGIAKIAQLVMKAVNSITRVLGISEKAAKTFEAISKAIKVIEPILKFLRDHKNAIATTTRMTQQAVQ
ncbi:hypothetical protein [Glycomyces buryatensis]|uniref:WXG100 family type VII secretion target n=1 Tax=Glycomyces buryatensis TaxID=2570927 RepID=A0A4S8Q1F7_9ACTN|nr:hypothetical protein [Glycomyces buryatensis]THV34379.1 hypothetical protein FAB82_24300 [Glycomyces buryatensis]